MNSFRFKSALRQLLRCPQELPVETLLCVSFFVIKVCSIRWNGPWCRDYNVFDDSVLSLFVPLLVLTFFLHRLNRWAYVLSFFVFVPLMFVNLEPFLWTLGYLLLFVLAAILLIVGVRPMANRPFADNVLHVVVQLCFAVLVGSLLSTVIIVIVYSFCYIFGIESVENLEFYIVAFVWYLVTPLVACSFIGLGDPGDEEPQVVAKPLRVVLDFILSPAVIIYTVILYAYFVKIVLEWDLPKGGVALMVVAFVAAAMAGMLAQYALPRRHYDWFYSRFTWIALLPLAMFWVGCLYRIQHYSFTEGRFSLVVAGVLMTLFVFMLLWRKSRHFQLMTVISAAAIVLFTYVPFISARSVGIRCQTKRLHGYISELKLTDERTGKFVTRVNRQHIESDSVLVAKYMEVDDIVQYLRKAHGDSVFTARYGQWKYDDLQYKKSTEKSKPKSKTAYRYDGAVDVTGYPVMLPWDSYKLNHNDSTIRVSRQNGSLMLEYPVTRLVKQHPELLEDTRKLCIYSNDSVMVVLRWLRIEDETGLVDGFSSSESLVFVRK